jgi:hypothetical protein
MPTAFMYAKPKVSNSEDSSFRSQALLLSLIFSGTGYQANAYALSLSSINDAFGIRFLTSFPRSRHLALLSLTVQHSY